MRNALKIFRALDNKEEAIKKMPQLASMIDKLAKKSVIHKNQASNLKSKLAKQVNAL
jgi:small subunit ribosomal protein S20